MRLVVGITADEAQRVSDEHSAENDEGYAMGRIQFMLDEIEELIRRGTKLGCYYVSYPVNFGSANHDNDVKKVVEELNNAGFTANYVKHVKLVDIAWVMPPSEMFNSKDCVK